MFVAPAATRFMQQPPTTFVALAATCFTQLLQLLLISFVAQAGRRFTQQPPITFALAATRFTQQPFSLRAVSKKFDFISRMQFVIIVGHPIHTCCLFQRNPQAPKMGIDKPLVLHVLAVVNVDETDDSAGA